jgi:hypothetical protein
MRDYHSRNKDKIKLNYLENKDKPTGKTCVECGEEIIGVVQKNMCRLCYKKSWNEKNSKTLDYIIKQKYHDMVARIKKYKYGEICPREEFYEIANNSPELKKLHKAWFESGYEHRLTPSVDRIDNNHGYTIDNIQFITQSENAKKAHIENPPRSRSIKCKLVKGDEVFYFESMRAASKFLGLNKGAISQNIKKGGTTLSGWKAYLVQDKNKK